VYLRPNKRVPFLLGEVADSKFEVGNVPNKPEGQPFIQGDEQRLAGSQQMVQAQTGHGGAHL
jgi:hypothetical protein